MPQRQNNIPRLKPTKSQPCNPLPSQSSSELSSEYSDDGKTIEKKIHVLKKENRELKEMVKALQEVVGHLCDKTDLVGGSAYWKVVEKSF